MQLKRIKSPTEEPVTLKAAKDHLNVSDDHELAAIRRKLQAATDFCERRLAGHRQLMTATYDLILEDFPGNNAWQRIELPRPPLQSISYLKYYDPDGTLQTLSSGSTGDYMSVAPSDEPGFVEPAYAKTWPTTRARLDAVTIRYLAGYPSRSKIPESTKEAVLLKLEHLWDPERVNEREIRRAIDDLLACNAYGHYC